MRLLKQSTTYNLSVFMTDSADHVSGKTGLTLTITASKDGAAFASITPIVTELATGWYKLALTTGHTDTIGDLAIHITGTGADPTDLACQVRANVLGDNLPSDVQTIKTQAVTCGAGVTVGPFVGNATAALGVDASGRVTVITYVGDTPQTGDAFARIGATGSGLTSLAPASTALSTAQWTNARAANLDNLDAAVSTRSTYAGGAVASVTGNVGGSVASVTAAVTVGTNNDKTGYALTSGERDAVADATLKRGVSNVEGTADDHSLAAIILATLESSISGTVWTIRKTDGTTFTTKAITTDAAAAPITGVT